MKYLAIFLCFLMPISLFANMVRNQPITETQPNGKKVSLYLSGDEYYHRVHDKDGHTVLKHPENGYLVYAVQEGDTVKPSNFIVGETDPAALGIQPNLLKKNPETAQRIREQKQMRDGGNRVSSIGSFNAITCFVRFEGEYEFTTTMPYDDYEVQFNSSAQASLKDYYDEVSHGQLAVTSHLYPEADGEGHVVSVQVNNDRNWYQPYSYPDNQLGYMTETIGQWRLQAMIAEVVSELDEQIPGSLDIDANDDDVMDALVLVVKGAKDTWGDILWPAYWTFSVNCGEINGVDVLHCILTFEDDFGPSVVCHEMGHNIGFPDLYHYGDSVPWDDIEPCSSWDIMDSNSNPPQHELCYMKWKYGHWFTTLTELTPTSTPTVYDLAAVTPSNTYPCYKIASSNPDQFYMVEFRKRTGRYESGIPSTGLIVYRINTTQNGNDDGPPDEVYVYRPGGDVDSEGTPADANFSSESGRTSIHNYTDPKPWLWVNSSSTPDGDLVITNVGSSSGTAIQFTLRTTVPYVWDGSTSTSWGTASNWVQNSVPSATDYVEIPSGTARSPYITTAVSCYHLTIKSGANLSIHNGSVTVTNDLENNGTITMTHADGLLTVERDLKFNSGSTANVSALATIDVHRWLEFHEGSAVSLSNGFIELSGGMHGYIRTYTPTTIYHLRSNKDDGWASGIGDVSTSNLTIAGNLYVLDGSTFNHYYAGATNLLGGYYAYSGAITHFNQGTLCMQGTVTKALSIADVSNYLNHVQIYKTGGASVTLTYPIDINGNLTITLGTLITNSNAINIGGNWVNNVGSSGFQEGTGTVTVDGGIDQVMYSENFYNLVLNKGGGELQIPSGSTVYCNSYDWTAGTYHVMGGTFSVVDLADPGIFGTIILSSGLIEYQQDSGQYADLRGNLTINGGTFNVMGSAGTNYLSFIDVGTLTMTSGVLDYVHQGIGISASYIFNDFVSGGTIRTSKGFACYRADFQPTGGTLELYGSTDCTVLNTTGSNLYNLTINKTSSKQENAFAETPWIPDREGYSEPPTRSNTVTGSGPININGAFRITAGTFVAPPTMNVAGSWYNTAGPAYFTEGTGTVVLDGTGTQYCNYPENFNILQLNKSAGSLRLNSAGANLTCNTYTWADGTVQVNSGTFTALDLSQDGIFGDFTTDTDGVINLHQDAAQRIDVNGFWSNSGGDINIYGGSTSSYFGFGGLGGITMTIGTIDFKEKGITIQSVTDFFTMNITGGHLRTAGSFYDSRGSVHFDGGELEMYGATNNTIRSGTGSYFNALTIYKPTGNYVALTSAVQINGVLDVDNGTFNTNGYTVKMGDDVLVGGTLKLTAGSSLNLGIGSGLVVEDDGIFESIGNSTTTATVTHDTSGYYGFTVQSGGEISAAYTIFEYMNANGINIEDGALVNATNSLNYCTFRYGISGGTLLKINNGQTITSTSVVFPTNTWSGSKNVSKTNNAGTIVFNTYSGGFSGAAYENDPDSRIFWGTGLQAVPTPYITYDSVQNQVWLDWSYPVTFNSFNIYRCTTPYGTYSLAGTSATTSWHTTQSGTKYFYKVTAVRNN